MSSANQNNNVLYKFEQIKLKIEYDIWMIILFTHDFPSKELNFVVKFGVGGVHGHLLLARLPPEPAHLTALQPRFEELVAVLVLLPHVFLGPRRNQRAIGAGRCILLVVGGADAGGVHLPRQLSQRWLTPGADLHWQENTLPLPRLRFSLLNLTRAVVCRRTRTPWRRGMHATPQ